MIAYEQFELENGLKVLVHQDKSTSFVAFNLLYNVGSKNEDPNKTGYAHLMEHLMFAGSKTAPNYDEPIDNAGGESNAFTNVDVTNYYIMLPKENIEIAFWLESDRMLQLNVTQNALDIQKKVVIEEFKETTINKPYGKVWHELSQLAYQKHAYQWPTIGKIPEHIENASLDEIYAFYKKYYGPNNAFLVLSGNVDVENAKKLTNKWFNNIPKSDFLKPNLPKEPLQINARRKTIECNAPLNAIYLAFQMGGRDDKQFYIADLISDILGNGKSSRLYRKLVKDEEIFVHINAYITGTVDNGLLIIEGKIQKDISIQEAENLIWEQLEILKTECLENRELQKIKNSVESALIYSEISILNKAMNLAYFAALGKPELINTEAELYQKISAQDIKKVANQILIESKSIVLEIKSKL